MSILLSSSRVSKAPRSGGLLGRAHRYEADRAVVQCDLEPVALDSGDVNEVAAMDLADRGGGSVGLLVNG